METHFKCPLSNTLGVSLKHEIESSLFDISLDLKRVQFLSRIMPRYPDSRQHVAARSIVDMGVTLCCIY